MAGLSRTALGGVSLLLVALTHGGGWWVAEWVQERSESPLGDLMTLTALMTLLMISSGVLALFLGDCLFGDRWRRSLLGEPVALSEDDEVAIPRNETLRFSFMLILVAALNGAALDQQSMGDFSAYYSADGYARTVLRGDDEDARRVVLIDLAQEPSRALASHAVNVILPLASEGDGVAVRGAAFDALGIIGERMSHSVDLIALGRATPGGWESDLMAVLRVGALEAAHLCLREETDGELLGACLGAVEGIRSTTSIPLLEDLLGGKGDAPRDAVLLALSGMRGHLRAVVPLTDVLRNSDSDPNERALAAFGIGEVVGHWRPSPVEESSSIPEEVTRAADAMNWAATRLDLRGQCVLVEALRKMRDGRTATALFSVFEGADGGSRCPSESLLRPGRREVQISRDEGLQFRALRGIAHIAEGNEEVLRWLKTQEDRGDELSGAMSLEIRSLIQRVEGGG